MAWRGALLAGVLALAACATSDAQQAALAAANPPAPRLILPEATARLPAEAAGFRRGQTLPARPPLEGQEISYFTVAARQRAAAVVRLAAVGAALPDGSASPAASAAFQAELQDAVAGRDRARQLQESRRFNLDALECAALEGTYGRQPVEALVCAGGVGGNLVRLRVSMPKQQPAVADSQAFASAIMAALRGR